MPLVSFLLPVRNARATLEAAIASLRWQTFTDWEAVVVDDGSSDGSAQRLAELASLEPRLRVFSRPPAGLVASLNFGLARCSGRFVARMDGDDICHPRRLERQLDWLEEFEVVGCGTRIFPMTEVRCGFLRYQNWLNSLLTPAQHRRDLLVESPLVHPSVTLHREWLEAVGGYRDQGWAEDYDLWLRLTERGARLVKTPEILFFWRDRPTRMTRTDQAYSAERLRALKVDYLLRNHLDTKRQAVIWGAGRNGKRLAREVVRQGGRVAAFADLHPGRIHQRIDDIPVLHPESVTRAPDLLHLSAVGQDGGRAQVRLEAHRLGLQEGIDFLCLA